MKLFKEITFAVALTLASFATMPSAFAHQIKLGNLVISHPWSRQSPMGADVSAGFFKITNNGTEDDRLVSATSEISPITQIHEMKMEGDVMKMRAIPSLDLPVGQTVELKPGGYHLMFMQLKAPLVAGSQIPVTLQFKNAQGQTLEHPVQVPIQALGQTTSGHGHAMPQHGAPAQHKAGGMQH